MDKKSYDLIRWPLLKQKLGGISRSTVERLEKSGKFPKRINLGKNSIAWRLEEIEEWLKNLKYLGIK